MNRETLLLALIPIAYLIGSIPFGLIVGKARGIDPRKAGSGNIGATNLGRLLGRKYFFIVFFLDLLKGALPVLMAGAVLRFSADNVTDCALWMAVAVAAVIGHNASIFLGFRGGKGVSTSAGVIVGIYPYFAIPAVVGFTTFGLIFKITRYVSVGSMLASAAFCVSYILLGLARGWPLLGAQLPLLCGSILFTLLIVYRHRGNIARLRAGTESRFEKTPAPEKVSS
jgi:acyl phosphate:glycerol-3-phosphate acyltransferase